MDPSYPFNPHSCGSSPHNVPGNVHRQTNTTPQSNAMLRFAAMTGNRNPVMVQLLQHNLKVFWEVRLLELEDDAAFRRTLFPVTRIKRAMKANPNVKMIGADSPLVLSKAIELFIMEMTLRSWFNAEESNRRVLLSMDIASNVLQARAYNFLMGRIPWDQIMNEMAADVVRRTWLHI